MDMSSILVTLVLCLLQYHGVLSFDANICPDESYIECATEGEYCEIPADVKEGYVSYGRNLRYMIVPFSNSNGQILKMQCDNDHGDIIVGTQKKCCYKATDTDYDLDSFTGQVSEGGAMEFNSFGEIYSMRYGVNGQFVYRTLYKSNGGCTNTFFNDPVYGTVKFCQLSSHNPPALDGAKWTLCANEGGSCNGDGSTMQYIKYGESNEYYYKLVKSSSVPCTNSFFGDPKVGTGKKCWRAPYFDAKYDRRDFFIGDDQMNFADAEAYCVSKGSNLASIHSEDELKRAMSLCRAKDEGNGNTAAGCYIGLHQTAEGQPWINTDGTSCDYGCNADGSATKSVKPWYGGEPNNAGGEDCAHLYDPQDYYINDINCGNTANYPICNVNENNRDCDMFAFDDWLDQCSTTYPEDRAQTDDAIAAVDAKVEANADEIRQLKETTIPEMDSSLTASIGETQSSLEDEIGSREDGDEALAAEIKTLRDTTIPDLRSSLQANIDDVESSLENKEEALEGRIDAVCNDLNDLTEKFNSLGSSAHSVPAGNNVDVLPISNDGILSTNRDLLLLSSLLVNIFALTMSFIICCNSNKSQIKYSKIARYSSSDDV